MTTPPSGRLPTGRNQPRRRSAPAPPATRRPLIGVLEPRKGQLVKDQSADKAVMVPYRTYHKHLPHDDENLIGAVAYPGQMPEAEDQIRGVLRRRRNVPYSKPDNFGISSAQQI